MLKQTCIRFTAVIVAMVLSGCAPIDDKVPDARAQNPDWEVGVRGEYKLNKIDLKLYRDSTGASGLVSVFIEAIEDGEIIPLGSTSIAETTLIPENDWQTLVLDPPIDLTIGKKYRISVRGGYDDIRGWTWGRSQGGGVDPYPAGDSSSGGATDFAFRTYINGTLDQQQPSVGYKVHITFPTALWQDFVAGAP